MPLFEAKKKKEKTNPFIEPGQFQESDLKIAELIQRRRLQILVHSKIYYDLDNNLISDKQFDEWGRELVELQKKYPEIAKEICYHKAFKDWDASTGAFLPLQDEWVTKKANQLITIGKKRGDIIEHKKVQQSTRKKSSEKSTRKKSSKLRSNALF